MTRSRTVITALCLVPVLALGACSGSDPEPEVADPSPTLPSSPSTTPVSGPVEPTMPAAAQGTDAAAAEAFVEFYWEMADYAQATGDLGGLRAISPARCKQCQQVLDFLESVDDRHGEIRGGETTTSNVSSAPVGSSGALLVVHFDLTNSRQLVDFPGSRDDEKYPAGTIEAEAILRSSAKGWQLEYWGEKR